MKILYEQVDNMMCSYQKYVIKKNMDMNNEEYKKRAQQFMDRLNELENEFGLTIVSDYQIDSDGFIESQLILYCDYGHVGEIIEYE